MGRAKKLETLDERIAVAQAKMAKAKAEYDATCNTVKELLAERDTRRQKILMSALSKSDKTFDDVLKFIEGGNNTDD